MIHDPRLLDQISGFPEGVFTGTVYRCTGLMKDPTAFSYAGGRWAPPGGEPGGFPVLYTSLERKAALAEVAA